MDFKNRTKMALAIALLTCQCSIVALEAELGQSGDESDVMQVDMTCEICTDSKPEAEFRTLTCGHSYCKECLNRMVDMAFSSKSTLELKCPHSACENRLSEQDIRIITDGDASKLAAYADITTQEWLKTQPDAKFCITPECPYVFLNPRNHRCAAPCPGCSKSHCTKCLSEDCTGLDCKDVVPTGAQDSGDIAWKLANTKPCPTCRTAIEKNEGCLHMTCKRCATEFCWKCLSKRWGHSACSEVSAARAHEIAADELPKIIKAAISNDVRLYNEAISEKANVNTAGPNGNSPLILACENKSFEMAYRLLENQDTDVNIQNSDGDTAFIVACRTGNIDLVEA